MSSRTKGKGEKEKMGTVFFSNVSLDISFCHMYVVFSVIFDDQTDCKSEMR